MGFDAAELGILLSELNGADAELCEQGCDISARLGDEVVGEKVAIAVDDAQDEGLICQIFHVILRGQKSLLIFG
jgi:hypothetical protein